VFDEWEHKSYDNGHHCNGKSGDIVDPAATRELFAHPFRDLPDSLDGGISFLLFVGTVGGWRCDDNAGGAFAPGTGLENKTL
jgi:hypothetical protein